jgi:hypothetical protein
MKSSRSAGIAAITSRHAARASSSRSVAIRLFFVRPADALARPAPGTRAHRHAGRLLPPRALHRQRCIGRVGQLRPHARMVVRGDRAWPTGRGSRGKTPRLAPLAQISLDGAFADREEVRYLRTWHPCLDRPHNPLPQIVTVCSHHSSIAEGQPLCNPL